MNELEQYRMQISGASTTISEKELLDLAEKHNVPSWIIDNFDESLFLFRLMRWIERESDGHYTFYA